MATILIKRGQQADLENLTLAEGELALAYNADKSKAEIYAGTGSGKVLLNPEADTDSALNSAKSYTDEKLANLVNGAPEAMDTLKELADVIDANGDAMTALQSAIGNKVDKESGKGLVSDTEKAAWNAKLSANSTIDGGTF